MLVRGGWGAGLVAAFRLSFGLSPPIEARRGRTLFRKAFPAMRRFKRWTFRRLKAAVAARRSSQPANVVDNASSSAAPNPLTARLARPSDGLLTRGPVSRKVFGRGASRILFCSLLALNAPYVMAQIPTSPFHAGAGLWPGDVDFELGSSDAPVIVEEYFSDTCPHCADFELHVFPQVRSQFIDTGMVRFVFKELPTAPTHLSALGFIIARCGGRDSYLKTLDEIFRNQVLLTKGMDLRQSALWIGAQAGLTEGQTQSCVDNDKAYMDLDQRLTNALALGISGTPSFVVNGRVIKPGRVLSGESYFGGSLSVVQFRALVRSAERIRDHPPPK